MILEIRHSIAEILSHQPLFRLLNGTELAKLAQGSYEYRVAKHEMLFQKGDIPQGVHMVVAGQVKLFLPSAAGGEKIVHMAGAGETFGEEGVFLHKPCPVAAQTTRDSILLVMKKQAIQDAMAGNCLLSGALMARMCTRLCDLIDNMETCEQRNSAQRVAHYLSQLAPNETECFELQLDVNKQTIAAQLNLAPETFSRVLGRLVKDGLIAMKGRSISVRNPGALRSFAA